MEHSHRARNSHLTPRSAFLPLLIFAAMASSISVPEGGAVQVLLGNGNGTFAAPVTYTTTPIFTGTVVLADFNGDGRQDILAVGAIPGGIRSGGVSLLLGNGDGTFQALFSSRHYPSLLRRHRRFQRRQQT